MIRGALVLLWFPALTAAAPQPGVTAEKWINRLTIRHQDSRAFVILFFDRARPEGLQEHRALQEDVERLNKLARRVDVLVVGVTPDREQAARLFVKRYRPRFAIGVQSGSHRSFSIKRFPTVVLIKGETRQSVEEASVAQWEGLEELLGPEPERGTVAPEELSVDEIKSDIERGGDFPSDLLEILRIRMEPDEFVQYCDELEQNSAPDAWLGPLRYQRHLADPGVSLKQPETTPAIDAIREAQRQGSRKLSEWTELLRTKDVWSDEEVFHFYLRHQGDAPQDLVYRADLMSALGETRDLRYVDVLLDMLDVEPDPGIRLKIINAISAVHDDHPAAFEPAVLERLEAHLAVEDNVRWARPMLEALIEQAQSRGAEAQRAP